MDGHQELLRATTNTIWKYTQDQIPFVVVEEIYNKQIKQTECKLMGNGFDEYFLIHRVILLQ
jgi:hypothetical protein